MILCTCDNGSFSISGLSIEDLEFIQEGIHRLFMESLKEEHREFRTKILQIDRAIDPELERHYKKLQL